MVEPGVCSPGVDVARERPDLIYIGRPGFIYSKGKAQDLSLYRLVFIIRYLLYFTKILNLRGTRVIYAPCQFNISPASD